MGSPQLNTLELAEHHLRTGRPEKALEELDRGADVSGEAGYWRISAAALYGLHRHEQALGAALQGLTLDPTDLELLDARALSELALGDAKAAEQTLQSALALYPHSEHLLAHYALALASSGKTAAARLAVVELMERGPGSRTALQARAQVAQRTKDKNLEHYVDELLAFDPENSIGHVLRASVARGARDIAGMKDAFADAAALDPGNSTLAKAARSTRVLGHGALAPNRFLFALGAGRYRFLLISLSVALMLLGQGAIRVVVLAANVGLWIYIRVARRVLLRAENLKYGDV